MLLVDCCTSELGQLPPPGDWYSPPVKDRAIQRADNQVIINGVPLPDNVVEELRILGLPLFSYNRGELEDAVIACHYDSKLIDDKAGENFRDKLTLTNEERILRSRESRKLTKFNDNEDDSCRYCYQ